uniref:pre-toxin TG domain-containing protein n=1 Tax=Chitinivorax sp. B TaxID=2502235 RepID=UPI0010F966D2
SLGLDLVPVLGSAKSAAQVVTGKDLLTGEPVNRWVEAGGIVLGVLPGGRLLTKGTTLAKVARGAEKEAVRGETFFRTMSPDHYERLMATGKLPATAETFISPTRAFSESYDGVLVQFNMKPGALSALESIGVRDTSALTKAMYSNMSLVSKGWPSSNAFFKAEGAQINIGLGGGAALDTFNVYIHSFSMVK